MADLCKLVWCAFAGLFRSRTSLEAEILVLRHQLNVLHRKSATRIAFSGVDRMVFAGLYRLAPSVLDALQIVKPATVIRWHEAHRGRDPAKKAFSLGLSLDSRG
jgi:hypothetical protein